MKKIPFTKMVGAGNDFIIIDPAQISSIDVRKNNRIFLDINTATAQTSYEKSTDTITFAVVCKLNYTKLAVAVCDRHMGIGADGLLVLEPSRKADYRMRIINSDGSKAEMCGNGARCMAVYIVNRGEKKKQFTIETLAGILEAEAQGEIARVHLSDPKDYRENISLDVNGRNLTVSYIDSGVPHAVVFVDGLKSIDVDHLGRTIRMNEVFKPRGTNVNFVEQIDRDFVELRTFERGVEAETFACGTGSVAAAMIAYLHANPSMKSKKNASMKVKTKSGEVLDVSFDLKEGIITNVWLKGSAKFVGQGEYFYV